MTTIVLDRLGRVCADLQQMPASVLAAMAAMQMPPAEVRDGISYLSAEQTEQLRVHFNAKGQRQTTERG